MSQRTKGFSLVEALVAMGVLSLLILYSFSLFPSAYNGIVYARDNFSATSVATTQAEYWRTQGYNWIAGSHLATDLAGNTQIGPTQFAWTVQPLFVAKNLYQVDVNVTWQNRSCEVTTWVNQ
jgi:prepilin-type N-terminal cleavage/methylation domain-containing protein